MLGDIATSYPTTPPYRASPRPPAPSLAAPRPDAAGPPTSPEAGGRAATILEQAVKRVAGVLFDGRLIEVRSFRDEASGRVVYRVADRASGEVLIQAPPQALLRFFASLREALGPLVEIEA